MFFKWQAFGFYLAVLFLKMLETLEMELHMAHKFNFNYTCHMGNTFNNHNDLCFTNCK